MYDKRWLSKSNLNKKRNLIELVFVQAPTLLSDTSACTFNSNSIIRVQEDKKIPLKLSNTNAN